jgi:hypothetical protein
MSKKLIVEVGLLNKMFSMFFKAKEKNKEDEFIDSLGKKNAELGKVWSKWNSDMENTLLATKRALKVHNLDTKEIDDLLNKYY